MNLFPGSSDGNSSSHSDARSQQHHHDENDISRTDEEGMERSVPEIERHLPDTNHSTNEESLARKNFDRGQSNDGVIPTNSPKTFEFRRSTRSKKSNHKRYHLEPPTSRTDGDDDDYDEEGGPSLIDEPQTHAHTINTNNNTTTSDRSTSHNDSKESKSRVSGHGIRYLEEEVDDPNNTSSDSSSSNDDSFECEIESDREYILRRNKIKRRRFFNRILHLICPFAPILHALFRCDMDTFWRIVPSILILKALYSSFLSLGLCTLFKIERYDSNHEMEAYLFGIWTYTDKITTDEHSLAGFLKDEVQRVETCRFHMNRIENDAPDELFLDDDGPYFDLARGFAIATTGLGFFSMVGLFLTAANVGWSCRGRRRSWVLFGSLMMCCVMQSMVFLVLFSDTCHDREYLESRRCTLQEGSGLIFMSCFCWAMTAIASLKMPRYINSSDCIAGGGLEDEHEHEHQHREIVHADSYIHGEGASGGKGQSLQGSFDGSLPRRSDGSRVMMGEKMTNRKGDGSIGDDDTVTVLSLDTASSVYSHTLD